MPKHPLSPNKRRRDADETVDGVWQRTKIERIGRVQTIETEENIMEMA